MTDLLNLRFFFHVAKKLSFTQAASELFVTQPAVTKRVKALEEECQLKLFGKQRGKLYLTEEGEELFKYAEQIFDYEREMEKAILDIRELKRGTLRLGLPKTFMRSALNMLMDDFHKKYPDIRINVKTGNSEEIIDDVLNHRVEIGNLGTIEKHPDIHLIPFFNDNIVLITSPLHHFVQAKSVSLEDVAKEPLILREKGSGTRKSVMGLFEKNNLAPNILLETSNPEYLTQLVQRGDGVSFSVQRTIEQEIESGKLAKVDIEGHQITMQLFLAHLENKPLSLAAKAYLELFFELNHMPSPPASK